MLPSLYFTLNDHKQNGEQIITVQNVGVNFNNITSFLNIYRIVGGSVFPVYRAALFVPGPAAPPGTLLAFLEFSAFP
jgi:hypothetical protein